MYKGKNKKEIDEFILQQTKLKLLQPNYKIVKKICEKRIFLFYKFTKKGCDLDYIITNNGIHLNFVIINSIFYWEIGDSMNHKYKIIQIVNPKAKFYEICKLINKNPYIDKKIKILNNYPL